MSVQVVQDPRDRAEVRGLRRLPSFRSTTCMPGLLILNGFEKKMSTEMPKVENFESCGGFGF